MVPIQPLLSSVVAKAVRPAPLTPEKVAFAWRLAVGAALARVTRVRLTPEHALEVAFDDPRWCEELERSGSTVLARVQEVVGAEHARRLLIIKPAGRRPRRRPRPAGAAHIPFDEGEAS